MTKLTRGCPCTKGYLAPKQDVSLCEGCCSRHLLCHEASSSPCMKNFILSPTRGDAPCMDAASAHAEADVASRGHHAHVLDEAARAYARVLSVSFGCTCVWNQMVVLRQFFYSSFRTFSHCRGLFLLRGPVLRPVSQRSGSRCECQNVHNRPILPRTHASLCPRPGPCGPAPAARPPRPGPPGPAPADRPPRT